MDDEYWMSKALELARIAAQKQEVPIGAIVIDQNNLVLGEGYNHSIQLNDPTAHAEIIALRAAALTCKNYRLPNTTLYVTIEPCLMCLGAILHARISRLVFGPSSPKMGAFKQLNDSYKLKLNWQGNLLSEPSVQLLRSFFKPKRS